MAHTYECLRLQRQLERVNYCLGNGECGSSMCSCFLLREAKIKEHKTCEARYGQRLKDLAEKLSHDGKSAAAGPD